MLSLVGLDGCRLWMKVSAFIWFLGEAGNPGLEILEILGHFYCGCPGKI